MPHHTPLIVALDFPSFEDTLLFVNQLDPKTVKLKIGLQLFVTVGPSIVETLQKMGFGIFLDLKFHDIPNQVKNACLAAAGLGVDLITVHAENGAECITLAKQALSALQQPPKLLAVTVLTSVSPENLKQQNITTSIEALVVHRAQLALSAGADGVVASSLETPILRQHFGQDPIIVTPGIRMAEDVSHDQARVATPEQAVASGSTYIVVGRPITQSPTPKKVIDTILQRLSMKG